MRRYVKRGGGAQRCKSAFSQGTRAVLELERPLGEASSRPVVAGCMAAWCVRRKYTTRGWAPEQWCNPLHAHCSTSKRPTTALKAGMLIFVYEAILGELAPT